MKVLILDEAEHDLHEGFRFYEAQATGLGTYFLDSLFADIDLLQTSGGIHSQHLGFHRQLAHRFPFAIYYEIKDGAVRVFAILDCRQDPGKMRDRLT